MLSPQTNGFFRSILLRVSSVMALSFGLHTSYVYADTAEFRKLQQRSEQAELQNNFGLAIELNQQLLQLRPKDLDTITTLSGLYGKAESPGKQLAWAQVALKLQPNHFPALINQGNALASLGKSAEAKESFRKAQRIDPSSPLPAYGLGVLAQESEQHSDALQLFQAALKLSPNFEDALFNLAVTYANLKNYDEALKILDRLIVQNPGAADVRYLRAEIQGLLIKNQLRDKKL